MKNNNVIITADITRITTDYAKKMNITEDEAMIQFLGSATYRALIDKETGLCYEMYEAIYEMFLKEMQVQ
ncbi:MAG: hypothetical protein LBC71_07515 [Oscillospiraceae bacterium]|jgi:hypothetical protein|nr:hypothetical protein [Oscillospiraceae bacterium]